MYNGLDQDQCQNCARVIGGNDPDAVVEGGLIVACGSCKPIEQPAHYYHNNCCCLKCSEVREHRDTTLFETPNILGKAEVMNIIQMPKSGKFFDPATGKFWDEIPY